MRDTPTGRALALLAELAPGEVLAKAKALAVQIEREERVRSYMAGRPVLLVASGLAALSLASAIVYGLLTYLLPLAVSALPGLRLPLLLLAALLWLAIIVGLMFPVLSFLQRAALAGEGEPGPPSS